MEVADGQDEHRREREVAEAPISVLLQKRAPLWRHPVRRHKDPLGIERIALEEPISGEPRDRDHGA